jgi:aminoglycoside 6'-N-acetyltransferase I
MDKDLNKPTLEINAFSESRIGPCARLYVDIFGRPPWYEQRSLEKASSILHNIIHKKRFIGFAAEYGQEARGYLLGYLWSTFFPLNRIYFIHELFVDADYQNMKIGKQLVMRLILELRSSRIPWIVLLTKKNTVAERFYKRMGFKSVIPGFSVNKRILMYYRPMRQSMEDDHEHGD